MADENPPSAIVNVKRIPFGPQAEKQILALATWMQIYGGIMLLSSGLQFLSMFGSRQITGLLNALIYLFLGVSSIDGAQAFRLVATTDIADMAYLMTAFRKLRGIFLLQGAMILLSLAFVLLAFGCLLLAGVIAAVVARP